MYKDVKASQTRRKKAEVNSDSVIFPKLNIQARKDAQIPQEKLADMLGINKTTLVNYEKGRTPIKTDTLIKYAQICNVSTDYLLGLSKVKTLENTLIQKKIGLSEDSIKMLEQHVQLYDTGKIKTIDYLLRSDHITAILPLVKNTSDMGLLNLITHYLIDDEDYGVENLPYITSTINNGSNLIIDGKFISKGVILSLITEKLVEYKNDLAKEHRKKIEKQKKKGSK